MLNYIIFKTASDAMMADDSIHLDGVRLIPLPSKFSKGCGLCLKVELNIDEVERILKEKNIDYDKRT